VNEDRSPAAPPLLSVEAVARHHPLPATTIFGPKRIFKAVDGVSFTLDQAEIFGVVGESGCGKSTLARMIMALETPQEGAIRFWGEDLFAMRPGRLKQLRHGFQMVFQDPYGSLDPRQNVGRIVAEPVRLETTKLSRADRRRRVAEALEAVGLAAKDAEKYPHEFSGGQRQRIAIARALITRPALIVADEPVSALDVSVQAQVLNLLLDLRERYRLAYVLISHDLGVVEQVCDRLAVMYLGRFVETGATDAIFDAPAHPYTRMLLEARPGLDPAKRRERRRITDPAPPPAEGCVFAPRCPFAADRCRAEAPALREIAQGRNGAPHRAACHFAETVMAETRSRT
jgi:peptide/nickel transport system ATP-binding protein